MVGLKLTSGRSNILSNQFVVTNDPDRELFHQDDRPQECRDEDRRAPRLQPQTRWLRDWQPLQEWYKVSISSYCIKTMGTN